MKKRAFVIKELIETTMRNKNNSNILIDGRHTSEPQNRNIIGVIYLLHIFKNVEVGTESIIM